MFINVVYKDPAELSTTLRRNSYETDISVEKNLLVNPNCPVRIMLEYIRKKSKLAAFTSFDLCDESGGLMGLFNLETYAYATEKFVHKNTYYVIVLKTESDKSISILPQLNHENNLYLELKTKVKKFMTEPSVEVKVSSAGKVTSSPGKVTPPVPGKVSSMKSAPKKGKK